MAADEEAILAGPAWATARMFRGGGRAATRVAREAQRVTQARRVGKAELVSGKREWGRESGFIRATRAAGRVVGVRAGGVTTLRSCPRYAA
jgi:hypothetical protein